MGLLSERNRRHLVAWISSTNCTLAAVPHPWLEGRALSRNRPSPQLRTRVRVRVWTAHYLLLLTWVDLGQLFAMRRAEGGIDRLSNQENIWGYGQVSVVVGSLAIFALYLNSLRRSVLLKQH